MNFVLLQASVNPLQKIPEGCTQLISLTELYLSDCLLEYIPANFGRLAKLKILELRENSLTSLPKSMERLVNLTRVDLSQNQFTEVGIIYLQILIWWMHGETKFTSTNVLLLQHSQSVTYFKPNYPCWGFNWFSLRYLKF